MELNLCPSCDAFVRSDWETCRVCSFEFAPASAEPAEPEVEGVVDFGEADFTEAVEGPEPFVTDTVEEIVPEPEAEWAFETEVEPYVDEGLAFEVAEPLQLNFNVDAEWTCPVLEDGVPEPEPEWSFESEESYETPDDSANVVSVEANETEVVAAEVLAAEVPHDEDSDEVAETEIPVLVAGPSRLAKVVTRAKASGVALQQSASRIRPVRRAIHMRPSSPETPRLGVALPSTAFDRSKLRVSMPAVRINRTVVLGSSALVATLAAAVGVGVFAIGGDGRADQVDAQPSATSIEQVSTTLPAPNAWARYSDPKGRFTVDFPGTPQFEPGSTDLMLGTSPDSGSKVYLYAKDLPAGHLFARNDGYLREALRNQATATNTSVKSTLFSTSAGVRQLDAHLTNNDKSLVIDSRIFVSGNTLYALYVSSTDPASDPKSFAKLTNSITTLK